MFRREKNEGGEIENFRKLTKESDKLKIFWWGVWNFFFNFYFTSPQKLKFLFRIWTFGTSSKKLNHRLNLPHNIYVRMPSGIIVTFLFLRIRFIQDCRSCSPCKQIISGGQQNHMVIFILFLQNFLLLERMRLLEFTFPHLSYIVTECRFF